MSLKFRYSALQYLCTLCMVTVFFCFLSAKIQQLSDLFLFLILFLSGWFIMNNRIDSFGIILMNEIAVRVVRYFYLNFRVITYYSSSPIIANQPRSQSINIFSFSRDHDHFERFLYIFSAPFYNLKKNAEIYVKSRQKNTIY